MKKRELENQELEKEEARINAFMPHLYKKTTSEETKKELKRFFYENEDYNKCDSYNPIVATWIIESLPPYERRLQMMKNMIKDEKDEKKKEKMEKALERMKKTAHEIVEQLGKRETTLTERLFVLWSYYEKEYNDFPAIEEDLDDLVISSYMKAFPEKK